MANSDLQNISDEKGNAVGVIVPISLWREIESQRETAHPIKSDAMRQRLALRPE
jgi:hypothetical protein